MERTGYRPLTYRKRVRMAATERSGRRRAYGNSEIRNAEAFRF
jgi:hypothetical protein